MSSPNLLLDLPSEIIFHVLSYLPDDDLIWKVGVTCKRLHFICHEKVACIKVCLGNAINTKTFVIIGICAKYKLQGFNLYLFYFKLIRKHRRPREQYISSGHLTPDHLEGVNENRDFDAKLKHGLKILSEAIKVKYLDIIRTKKPNFILTDLFTT